MTNCYVFHGPEEFLRAEAIQALRAQLGDASMAAMHTTLLEGRKLTLGELSTTADALPFLADRRLVVVTGLLGRLEGKGGKPSKADQAFAVGLAEYLPRVPSSTWLVFDEDRTLED